MSLYLFDLIARGQRIADQNGNELPDLKAATLSAELSLCEIAAEYLKAGANVEVEAIVICDADHNEIGRIATSEAVQPYFDAINKGVFE